MIARMIPPSGPLSGSGPYRQNATRLILAAFSMISMAIKTAIGLRRTKTPARQIANDAAAKAYVQSLALALHTELREKGVHVTLLPPGPTDTPVLPKLGFTPERMPLKPIKPEQCADEGLHALRKNRPVIVPGRLNRVMYAMVPAKLAHALMVRMLTNGLKARAAASDAPAEAH